MKILKEGSLLVVLVVLGTVCAIGILSRVFLGNDNAIEQSAEQIIEDETGLKIDLSPDKEDR